MPGRNVIKIYVPDAYYHLYNRGINRSPIFLDEEDFRYFEWLLERSMGTKPTNDSKGREYTWLRDSLELNAYCLMSTHFHFLTYQREEQGISKFMRSIGTAYTSYFNKKYRRRGPLFENIYRAVMIGSDPQLLHITRYIHLNHQDFKRWQHSSFHDYIGNQSRPWLEPGRILELFDNDKRQYYDFVLDYEDMQRELEEIKYELADTGLY